MDPDAYYCPKCRNYYCFHCRARLLASDKQYQRGNQACDYYGKLLCGICDSEVRKEEPTAVYLEPEDGYWPLLVIVSFILAVLTWLASSFSVGLFFGIAAFAGGDDPFRGDEYFPRTVSTCIRRDIRKLTGSPGDDLTLFSMYIGHG